MTEEKLKRANEIKEEISFLRKGISMFDKFFNDLKCSNQIIISANQISHCSLFPDKIDEDKGIALSIAEILNTLNSATL